MSKKAITDTDIDILAESFGGNKLTISSKNSARKIRKRTQQVDADDSTDDERVTDGVAKYKIEENWKEFIEDLSIHDYKKSIDEENLKYSFVLHAFGRGIYYSEPVNAIYEDDSGLKDTHLKQNTGRKTLSNTTFPIDSVAFDSEIDYVANRRMTDRSEKRKEKNGSGLPKNRFYMPKTTWSFQSSNVKETKGVKKMTNTSRDDWTIYQDEEIPYLKKKSSNWVENVATSLSGAPQDDAAQIRAMLRGDKIEGSTQKLEKLAFLTNLFFGSETVRSPVGFTSHQMFLDLIGSDQTGFQTWKEAFENGNFPQIGEGAINALRLLNYDYNGSMPYNYRYDANMGFEDTRVFKSSPFSPQKQSQQAARSIISAETRVAEAWLALKFPDEPQTPESLMKVLPGQIQEWYRGVDLSHFSPEVVAQKRSIPLEKESTQKPHNLAEDFEEEVIDFNQEHELLTQPDLMSCYNDASEKSAKKLEHKHRGKLERNLTDDERFICLRMECDGNAGLSFNPNYGEGYAEIKEDDQLLAICPIQSISTDHDGHKEVIKNFIDSHKEKGAKMIFSIHGDHHYKTLAVNPANKLYRYIDPMHDSADGVIKHEVLKSALNDIGYSRFGCSYEKQQYSEAIDKENKGVISHNNECAFHNVYTTIRIAQSEEIGSYLGDMKRYGMTMMGMEQDTLTPEFAREYIRPFYEEFFEKLREFISDEKGSPNTSTSSSVAENVVDQILEKSPSTMRK